MKSSAVSPTKKSGYTKTSLASETGAKLTDCLLLGLAVWLSLVLYVNRLGFYMDDWGFLRMLSESPDPSFLGLSRWIYTHDLLVQERPVQAVLLAGLYRLFGFQPLGYHLANAVILSGIAGLFYLVLRQLAQPRWLALSIPFVYILLPHYSTDRFWVAAFQATLSIFLYLLSLYADLRALQSSSTRLWVWKALSFVSLIGSGFAYELTVPLFLVNLLLIGFRARQLKAESGRTPLTRSTWPLHMGSNLLAMALLAGYKALTTNRLNVETDLLTHAISLAVGALKVNYGTYGLGLPYVIGWIAGNRPDWALFGLGTLLGVVIFAAIYTANRRAKDFPGRRFWSWMIISGLAVFALGYAVFLVNADIWFTSASIGNRMAIAAALGVAVSFVGGLGLLSSLLPWVGRRHTFFALLVALLGISGFLINNTLAGYWAEAYQQQQDILADIRKHNPTLPSRSTLVLEGVCLGHGGAYILNGSRDLPSLLILAYGDRSLWAAASELRPQIHAEGLSMVVNGKTEFFAYTDHLLIYDYREKETVPVPDAEAARDFYQTTQFNPERDCPPGFAWGVNE